MCERNRNDIKKTSLILLFNTFFSCCYGQLQETAAIDSIFAKRDTPGSPGGSLGVIKEGKLMGAKGYGMANLEYVPDSAYRSVLKTTL